MNLTGCRKELHTVFASAAAPDFSHLNGEYIVSILMLPGYGILNHRKVLYTKNGTHSGYNVLFHKIWGRFSIEEGQTPAPDSFHSAVINYDIPENSFFIRRIRDYIRCVEEDNYLGQAYYLLSDKTIFLGYFTMEKISHNRIFV